MEEQTHTIPAGPVELTGDLTVPDDARAVVLFAHGSGSSRLSERNRYVASVLTEAGLATLLFDLLTDDEARDRAKVFDIPLLADRLVRATDWLRDLPDFEFDRLGYFGASTGAAAALRAATAPSVEVDAIVSRGGRPDLAREDLPNVRTPTLLIVGALDLPVIDMNYDAQSRLGGPNRMSIVPDASHLFEEPGALDAVADLAKDWFAQHLVGVTP